MMKGDNIMLMSMHFVKSVTVIIIILILNNLSYSETNEVQYKRITECNVPGLDTVVYGLNVIKPIDIVQLIETLAHIGGIKNIVISSGISGKTMKLKFDNITVGKALEIILAANNLAYQIQDGVITIMTDEEFKEKYGRSFYDNKIVKTVQLKYADPARTATMLNPIKSSTGTVIADPATGTLILIDTPEKISQMERIISLADINTINRVIPVETKSFTLQYADITKVQSQVSSLISPEVGKLFVDERTKTLVVTDLPYKLEKISELITFLDKPSKQVFIEAMITQVNLYDDFRLGINWDHVFEKIGPRYRIAVSSQPYAISGLGDSVVLPTGRVIYNTIAGGTDINMVLETLKTYGEINMLSNPHIAVEDGKEALIKVVTDEPYAEAQLESGTTNVVGETIKFIEVGTSLIVTPKVNDEDIITMNIRPEVSSVVGQYQAFRAVPVVRKSFAETTVSILNGQSIIIAGMIDQKSIEKKVTIPLLGNIPVIGRLFSSTSKSIQNVEHVVFLTPRIITGKEPFSRIKDMDKEPKGIRVLK